MIPLTPNYGVWHPNQVYCLFRINVTIWLLEVVLQPLHPVLVLEGQAPENGPKWFTIAKHMDFDSKMKYLFSLKLKLQFHSLQSFLASYSPLTLFLTFRSIWGSWKWSQIIPHIQNLWVRHPNQRTSPCWTYSSPDPPNEIPEALGRKW